MTLTTSEYWDVDGAALNTFAHNIETLGGRWRNAPLEGENFNVPTRAGTIWIPKTPSEKKLSLAMWVRGCDADGLEPAGDPAKLAQFNENWRALLKLFSVRHRLLAVTRRWYETVGAPAIKSATAQAELVGSMDLAMMGRRGGRFVAELNLPEPYFFAAAVAAAGISGGSVVNNAGDDLTPSLTIRFSGAASNPTLTNATTGQSVTYVGEIAGGAWVELNVRDFTASTSGGANVAGAVTHVGGPRWMELLPGNNTLICSSGTATVTHQPAYH